MTLWNATGPLASEETLVAVRDRLGQTLSVELDQVSRDALENITVTISNPEAGEATEATLLQVLEALAGTLQVAGTVAVSNLPVTQPVSGTVHVDNPTANPETGLAKDATLTDGTQHTRVDNFPTTQPVSGTVSVSNLPATQPVSGSVEVSNDSGNPLPVNGTVNVGNLPATQPVSGTVAVSNLPVTQPVSGTVEVANDVGNPLPVSGTVIVGNPTTNPEIGLAKDATLISSLLAVADRLDLLTQILYDNPSDQDRPFARDNADQLRVLLSGGGADVTAIRWGNNNVAPASYYVTGGPNSMDARELAMQQSDVAFDAERRAWVIT